MAVTRRPKPAQQDQLNAEFHGPSYSNHELAFLIEHFGEPAEVAIPEDEDLPVGVNAKAVGPILERTFKMDLLEQSLRKSQDNPELAIWCGFDKLRAICQATLDWNETVKELKARTAMSDGPVRRAAGAPSLHMWDPDTDIPYLGGVGADADIVRTAIDGTQRIPLFVMLRETGIGSIKELSGVAKLLKNKSAKSKSAAEPVGESRKSLLEDAPNALLYNQGTTTSTVECPICGHTEVFETTKPSTKVQAKRRMMKHLDTVKVKKEQHHILSQRLKSGRAGQAERTMTDHVREHAQDAQDSAAE